MSAMCSQIANTTHCRRALAQQNLTSKYDNFLSRLHASSAGEKDIPGSGDVSSEASNCAPHAQTLEDC